VELQQVFLESQALEKEKEESSSTATTLLLNVKERELEAAKSRGLLDYVQLETDDDLQSSSSAMSRGNIFMTMNDTEDTLLASDDGSNQEMSMLDEWERARRNSSDGHGDDNSIIDSPGEDSDDDIL
jgi:hypothetical protein